MDCSEFMLKFLSLVIHFFEFKKTNHVVLFNCYEPNVAIGLQTKLSQNNIFTTTRYLYQNDSVPMNANKLGFLLNASWNDWDLAFKQFDPSDIFQPQFTWLIVSDNLTETTEKLLNFPAVVDSDVTIVYKNGSGYKLYEFYKITPNIKTFILNNVGHWDSKLQYLFSKTKRWDLTGVTMRCPIVVSDRIVNETFEDYLAGKKPHIDSLHKLKFYSVLLYLQDMFHYRYELIRVNSWGYFRNGSFDGMVGAMQRGEADLGGSTAFLRADRAKLVDYIVETWPSRQCFILRHPKHPGSYYCIYTRPLTNRVWYCIIAMLVVISSAMAIIMKMVGGNYDSSASLAVLFTCSAMCQQGMSICRKSIPVKILVFATFVFTITIYQYYNAVVVSTLLRETPKNIKTLADLVRSDLKAGAEDVVYVKDFFKRTTDPIALQMYYKKIVQNFHTPDAGMALVKRGGFAFHVDSVVAYRIMRKTFSEQEICEAHEVPMYPPQKMAVIVPKRSPYKEHFAYGIRKMFEAGILHRLRLVWDEPKPLCVRSARSSMISVSLREFSMALVLLCVGMLTAVIVLAGEIVVHRMKNNTIKLRSAVIINKR